ncbi:hypothetical protein JOF39_002868 [Glutamicibacter protophormiae]|uniref:Transposase n=1 Tax=Glutamicibacter protophormiae TaxID=37930 RepID=A0ABS4XTH0_GLUPR|nr:hypothetical protein [Glutamicibacter protophormiae]
MELRNRIQETLDGLPNPCKGRGGRPKALGLHQLLRIVLYLLCHIIRQSFIADQ